MPKYLLLLPIALLLMSLNTLRAQSSAPEDLTRYVKPVIGTERMGHTYPGATVPFGMVQLSPDTDTIPYEMNGKYNPDVYKYCAGYQYGDKTIVGFSHTHFSGTGHSDLGDFLVMPTTGELKLNPGTAADPSDGFRSGFSHSTEVAAADYYKVELEKYKIKAELTATTRVGFHQYTFPKSDSAHIILDLMYGIYNYEDKNVWTSLKVVNDTLVTGYRQTSGWGRTRTLYFAMSFSKAFYAYGNKNFSRKQVYRGFWGKWDQGHNFPEIAARQIRAYFDFKTGEAEAIKVKLAISPVSTENALTNLRTETPGWDFNAVKEQGRALWQKELSKITISTKDSVEKQNFYTSMYHAFVGTTIYMDGDSSYRGPDQNIHKTTGFTNYTTFSLWDTYRALHPLFNLIQPRRNGDMVQSMLAHYDQSAEHMLPVWANSGNENWCMTGYHSVPVVCDAIVKDNTPFDKNKALDACIATATHRSYEGIGFYIDNGYVPEDKSGSSVSKTLEYAFDDWCIAQAAKKLGRDDVYQVFFKRSRNYRNVWDASVGFMRPKLSDGTFRKDFDPLRTIDEGFIEGNAWNYSFYVPQAPDSLIALMGGKKKFVKHLDSLFTMELPNKYFAETEDITRDGIIGNYVHGNEPSHHVIYLYNFTDEPWKSGARIRQVLPMQYKNTPDGLGGNDDAGQMSAWYIFSTLGFYPIAPASDQYWIGSPAVDGATITLENGKTFSVKTVGQGPKNVYVKKLLLNGKPLNRKYITHGEIMSGGELSFYLSSKPGSR